MGVVEQPVVQVTWITTQTTTTVKTGGGVLERLIIPTPTANATVKVFDNTTNAGTVLLETITFPAAPFGGPLTLELDLSFYVGCTVVTGAATMSVGVATR